MTVNCGLLFGWALTYAENLQPARGVCPVECGKAGVDAAAQERRSSRRRGELQQLLATESPLL
jgi:hypothetical protein